MGAWKFMNTHYPKPHFKLLALNPCLAVGPMLPKGLNASQVGPPPISFQGVLVCGCGLHGR